MSRFEQLAPQAPDALLHLMAQFRADPRETKIDLGVGVYRNEAGVTPIMRAVKAGEARLHGAAETKVYEGSRGNVVFCDHIEKMLLGGEYAGLTDRVTSLTAPGGCGALFLGMGLMRRLNPAGSVWVSTPTWPNHPHIAREMGLAVKNYRYLDEAKIGLDFEGMVADIKSAAPGDLIILQGPCHNPTGVDQTVDQWKTLAGVIAEGGLVPLIDIAYHGLGNDLDGDLDGVQAALALLPEALVSYSCSKNFGLYRERAGCMVALAATPAAKDIVQGHLASIARAAYSMPPANGAGIVATILSDADLTADWKAELAEMRGRVQSLRDALATALVAKTGMNSLSGLSAQKGMFSLLPIKEGAAATLASDHAVYMPGSGRINVAGLLIEDIDRLADTVAPYLG